MVTKRCTTCGRIRKVRPRDRRCKKPTLGTWGDTHYCWGLLEKVAAPKPKAIPQLAAAARAKVCRAMAEKCRVRQTFYTKCAYRTLKQAERFEAKAAQWERRAAMSNEELVAEHAKRATRPPKLRAIKIGGNL